MRTVTANIAFQINSDKVAIKIVPAEGASINATLSYSVDGITWTNYATAITDANSVVCNVPKYMYLKLNQDAIITEN